MKKLPLMFCMLLGFSTISYAQSAIPQKITDTRSSEPEKTTGKITTKSGLIYEVLKSGNSQKPTIHDEVVYHIITSLPNGTILNDTYKRGKPVTSKVKEVISGLSQGLLLMGIGSKYRLTIIPDLAFGEEGGLGGRLPPNTNIIYEVELMEIHKKEATFDYSDMLYSR